jgi:hypothetical protein
MDITVQLPRDDRRRLAILRARAERGRTVTRTYGAILVVLGALIVAAVFWLHANGLSLAIGGLAVLGGGWVFNLPDRQLAEAAADRPPYAEGTCTVRVTDDGLHLAYPHASWQFGWPAVTGVVCRDGLWLFSSGRHLLLGLPEASLGPAEAEQLGDFLAERALLRT